MTIRVVSFFFAFLLTATAQAKVVDQLIAVIDGDPFTLSNVTSYAKTKLGRDFPSSDLKNLNAADLEVLELFITDKLMEAEVREAGVNITDEEIDHYIDQIKQRNRLTDEELARALAREGQTRATYRTAVKSELERSEIINRQVRKRVNITADDVERYYRLNAKNFMTEDRARLRHILLPVAESASAAEVEAVTRKANDLHARIVAGEDFSKLAEQYSDGAGRNAGGDIGWVKRGTLLKPIEDVAFEKLAVGEVSEPVRSSMGVHLVKLEAKESGRVPPLSVVSSRIKEDLYAKALEERFAQWLKTDLRRKHRVDIKLAGVVFKPEDSRAGTVDYLVAKSGRPNRKQERTLLSYLNPFSYIYQEIPFEDTDPESPVAGKSIVSLFGIPLFTTESVDDYPDVLSAPEKSDRNQTAKSSGGFFSSIVDSLNPFKR
jgi:peptidyl-prolyl cis-trans isomerase SurA